MWTNEAILRIRQISSVMKARASVTIVTGCLVAFLRSLLSPRMPTSALVRLMSVIVSVVRTVRWRVVLPWETSLVTISRTLRVVGTSVARSDVFDVTQVITLTIAMIVLALTAYPATSLPSLIYGHRITQHSSAAGEAWC